MNTIWEEPETTGAERYATVIDHTPAAALLLDGDDVFFLKMEDPHLLPIGTSESVDGMEPICTLDELNVCMTEMEVGEYGTAEV